MHRPPRINLLVRKTISFISTQRVRAAALLASTLMIVAVGMILGLASGKGAWATCVVFGSNITCFGPVPAPDQNMGAGNETLTTIGVTTINDDVFGGTGNDTVNINAGGTVLRDVRGGDDSDTLNITGNVGRDVRGDAGNDFINILGGNISRYADGDDGNDTITMTAGSVLRIRGGNGNDTITVSGGTVTERINGNAGNDDILLTGGTIALVLGAGGTDTITVDGATITGDVGGGGGNDTIDLISLGAPIGGDVSGQGGNDTVIFRPAVDVSDIAGTITGNNGTDTLQFEQPSGGTRNLTDTDAAKISTFENIDVFGNGTLVLTDNDGDPNTPILDAGNSGGSTIDIQEGTLDFANANSSIRGTTITADAGTTITGSGLLDGNTTFNGLIEPGGAGIGALNVDGTLTFGTTSTTIIDLADIAPVNGDINPANRGTEFDIVDATGAVSIAGGAALVIDFLSPTSTVSIGDAFDIVTGSSVTGDFSLIVRPADLIAGAQWETNSTGTELQLLLVNDVPEPAIPAIFMAGLFAAFQVQRRRRRAVVT